MRASLPGVHACGGYVLCEYQFGVCDGLTFLSVYQLLWLKEEEKPSVYCGVVAPSCGLIESLLEWKCTTCSLRDLQLIFGCNEVALLLKMAINYFRCFDYRGVCSSLHQAAEL